MGQREYALTLHLLLQLRVKRAGPLELLRGPNPEHCGSFFAQNRNVHALMLWWSDAKHCGSFFAQDRNVHALGEGVTIGFDRISEGTNCSVASLAGIVHLLKAVGALGTPVHRFLNWS